MRNLIIDIGNSSVKLAICEHSEVVWRDTQKELCLAYLVDILTKDMDLNAAIISTTRHRDTELEQLLESYLPQVIFLDHTTPTPLRNLYTTPHTLGSDRLAAAVGAWSLEPGAWSLVVDLGTAITIDIVSDKGEFMGGNISPGMAMRFQSLHDLTARLPHCTPPTAPTLVGKSTSEAIENGVTNGIIHEIEGYIDRISAQNRDIKIFFTGRDAFYFADKLKNPIFATCDLVLFGLNRIIEYNAQKNRL